MKPQNFNGTTDFDEFLSQFEITCEINGWQYREKSLYLASCLSGDARSVLSELDHDGRRDFNTLIEKLANRFGSVNRSEIYRTQLKSKVRNKGESIPELAQAIKKVVRQTYLGVNKDVIETMAIDNFVDPLTDSDIRLRVRELGPKTLADAERTALRLESHKIADKQRSRLVGQIDTNGRQIYNEHQGESSDSFKTLQNSINSLSGHVKDLKTQNRQNESNRRFVNGKSQNNSNFGRANRSRQNNPAPSYNCTEGLLVKIVEITFIAILTKTGPRRLSVLVQMTLSAEIDKTMTIKLLITTIEMDLHSLQIIRETRISRFGGPPTDII